MNRRLSRYYERSNSAIISQIVCAVAFCLFTFLYFYVFQADVMDFRLKSILNDISFYNAFAFASLTVILLCAVAYIFIRTVNVYRHFHALTYFPSLLLMWVIAEMDVDNDKSIISLFCLLLLPLGTVISEYLLPSVFRHKVRAFFLCKAWPNIMLLVLMFFFICAFSSYGTIQRYRLKTERLIQLNKYDEALKVGYKSSHTDKSLSMLRIYALSKLGLLGDRLFYYPIAGKSDALLPDGKDVKCLLLNDENIYRYLYLSDKSNLKVSRVKDLKELPADIYKGKPIVHYILCSYLLDKDIDGFVSCLQRVGYADLAQLPRHYREALILYRHIRSKHIISYHNSPMDADYEDMQALGQKYHMSKEECRSVIEDTYGNTYWYYYYNL